MKVTFAYNKGKDIWCLLNKGKSSSNSSQPTRQYRELIAFAGEQPNEAQTAEFIDRYLADNAIYVSERITEYQNEWDAVSDEFQRRAENVFDTSLSYDVAAYLSINSRSPYSLRKHYFFVTVPAYSVRKTAMHELWHFYTWEKFGQEWENKLGAQKYNDLKEALTVLLNAECQDLMPGVEDKGYPQHGELRNKIIELWRKEKNINHLWAELVK